MEAYPSWNLKTDMIQDWAYYDDAFSSDECDSIVEYCRQQDLKESVIGNEHSLDLSVRKSKVAFIPPTSFMIPHYQKLSAIIDTLNQQFFKFDLHGFGEHLQFTEYDAPGGKYNSHVDRGFNIPVRKLSIVLQLTDPKNYEGGELELFVNMEIPTKLPKTRGTLIAFPSFQVHRVTPLTKGTRNSLVGWINGKQFT
jgi:PKHD-type hydroxylase